MSEHQYSLFELSGLTVPAPFGGLLAATQPYVELQEAFIKHYNKFAHGEYETICVSISGGRIATA
jgi:hypothetical protein